MSKWEVETKYGRGNGGGSKYDVYNDKLAIIVYPRGDVALTLASVKALQDCKYVNLLRDGKLVGFRQAKKEYPNAFALGHNNHKSPGKLQRVACKVFSRDHGLAFADRITVWSAYMQDGVLVVDTSKSPIEFFTHEERHRGA